MSRNRRRERQAAQRGGEASTRRAGAARPGEVAEQPVFASISEVTRRYGLAIASLFIVAYGLSFLARPLPDLSVAADPETKVFRFNLLDATLGSTPQEYWSAWTGGAGGWSELTTRMGVLGGALAISCWAWALGQLCLLAGGASRQMTGWERLWISLAVGWQLNSLLTLAIGLAGGLRPVAFVAAKFSVFLLLAGMAAWKTWALSRQPSHKASRWALASDSAPRADRVPRVARWIGRGAAGVAVFCGAWILLGAMLPPVEFDVLEYHLQVPKEWVRAGRIGFLPHNVYGNMPLGAELHAIDSMLLGVGAGSWWWGGLVGKTVMAMMGLATAGLVAVAARRWWGPPAGSVAALLYLSTPWVVKAGFLGWNELAFGLYFFAAVYCWLRWRERQAISSGEPESTAEQRSHATPAEGGGDEPAGTASELRQAEAGEAELKEVEKWQRHAAWRWLILAGWMAGAALSVKYPAVVFVILPLLCSTFLLPLLAKFEAAGAAGETAAGRGQGQAIPAWSTAFQWASLLAGVTLLSSGLWLAKNAALAGNPTYPLLAGLWGGLPEELAERWREAHQVSDANGWTAGRFAADVDQALLGSQWLSPLLVPLAALAYSLSGARWRRRWLTFFLLTTFVLWWLLTHRIERFLVPVYPLLACLAALAMQKLNQGPRRLGWQILLTLALLAGTLYNVLVIVSPIPVMGENRVLASWERLREPLSYRDRVHARIDQLAAPGQRVLLVGDATPFHLQTPAIYATCFNPEPLEQLTAGQSPREVQAALQAADVAYVFVDWQEIARYRAPGSYGFSDYVQPELIERWKNAGVLESIDIGLPPQQAQLFRVVGASGDDAPLSGPARGAQP